MRAANYIRVSSTEQAEEGYSIGAQEEKLSAYCKAKDWTVVETYVDPGYTGSNTDRPALKKMMKDIDAHKIDVVVVYKLDRFTRSQKDCITLLEDLLLPNGCDFVSINENFDTSTPYGRAMIGILSVFAQLERETIRERTVMGRIERAKTGLYSGNANLPIGYDYVDGKLIINEYEAMQVREIFDLYNNSVSIHKILDIFIEKGYKNKHGEWKHLNTIKRILASKLYHGELKYKGEYYKGQHPSIITKEVFDKAQAVHKIYTETAIGHRKTPFMSTHLLTGLLFCGECGARMHAKTISRNSEPSYLCYSVSRTAKKYIVDSKCTLSPVNCSEIEKYVVNSIRSLDLSAIKELQKSNESVSDSQNTMQTILQQIQFIEKKTAKIMDLYLDDRMSKDVLSVKMGELEKEKAALNIELEKLEKIKKPVTPKSIIKKISVMDEIFDGGTIEQKKAFLNGLISSIEVSNDKIIIKWNFV